MTLSIFINRTCLSIILILIFSSIEVKAQTDDPVPKKPVIDSEWCRISEAQDLDSLNGTDLNRQDVVDHGFIQAEDGTCQSP